MRENNTLIEKGEMALNSLEKAREYVSHALLLGWADLISRDSLILNFVKYSKIKKMKSALEEAQKALSTFSESYSLFTNKKFRISTFWSIMDFADSSFADIIVQMKLSDIKNEIERTIQEIKSVTSLYCY